MKKVIYLPNAAGHYKPVAVPKYLLPTFFHGLHKPSALSRGLRIHRANAPHSFKIYGRPDDVNKSAYGLPGYVENLRHFLNRFAKKLDPDMETVTDIHLHEECKNYWISFTMYDPWALALEKAGLILL